ncbi:hypothetical protein EYF80_015726 [Liparis tanakae]|uniref:Uncharacterized protein n=1 Tax=Liparis tanakae TaxID=230148 RepID=A0A4Z2I9K4_9TELE|nr:hypothetical protein EYF80_015726 [Liparis tanakae]
MSFNAEVEFVFIVLTACEFVQTSEGQELLLLLRDIRGPVTQSVEELGVVLHVVVHEGVDEEVAVVVALREQHTTSSLKTTGIFFSEQTAIRLSGSSWLADRNWSSRPWSMRMSSGGPEYDDASTVASALTSQAALSGPRYPEKAFCPQGHCTGLQMGAKADTA